MDSQTGELYSSPEEARKAGVPKERIVKLWGPENAIKDISAAVKAERRRKNKAARKSRKKNR